MNHIILCEGSTDYFLLQYYMREAYQWSDDKAIQAGILKLSGQKSRNLSKNSDKLTIMSVGGCSRMGEGLRAVMERNFLAPPDLSNVYSNIVIITDQDEVGTEQSFIQLVSDILSEYNVILTNQITNNCWIQCEMSNQVGIKENFSILLLILPFEKCGAMETFLLDAICIDNAYDKVIIEQCREFVDRIDPDKKYLSSRRYITKAKFDTYFSVRTPAEQFAERQNILKSVKWEQYTKIQTDLEKLGDL